jgi:UDP-N-acetylglucosamine acyltransferase
MIGHDVRIGPFCVIGGDVRIGDGCQLDSHVVIHDGTTVGRDNRIHAAAIIGDAPQHLKAEGVTGRLTIGDRNTIREHVTIHRALHHGEQTIVGNENLLMVNVHVAHDCLIGDNVVLVNNVMLAGHVTVENHAYVSGGVGVHQFCRVGKYAMVAGVGRITRDVPPYVMADSSVRGVIGLNFVGLRRKGFTREQITQLKEAYRVIYRSEFSWPQILEQLDSRFSTGPAAAFHEFFQLCRRGHLPQRAERGYPTLSVVRADPAGPPEASRAAA